MHVGVEESLPIEYPPPFDAIEDDAVTAPVCDRSLTRLRDLDFGS